MAKKLQLTIAEPCHENWDGMTPVEKGKFCGSCQKQVIDFSNMSDRQVADFFKKPSTGSVCGRFMTDQLDRPIEIPRKRIPWLKYFFQIAIPAFLVSIKATAQKTQGQINVKSMSKDTTKRGGVFTNERITLGMVARPENLKPFLGDTIVALPKEPVQPIKGEITIETPATKPVCTSEIMMGAIAIGIPAETNKINRNAISGRVVDEQGQPIPFASIETGKEGRGVIADENGFFKLNYKLWKKGSEILVSSVGFETKKINRVEEEFQSGDLYVQLKSNAMLPEVVLTALGSISCSRTMGKTLVMGQSMLVTEKKDIIIKKEVELPIEENRQFVYPNPLQSGSTLNLSFKQLDEGYYHLHLINPSGQLLHQKEIWIDAEARLLNVEVPSIAAGSYFLVLTNKKTGKKFSEKIIIQ